MLAVTPRNILVRYAQVCWTHTHQVTERCPRTTPCYMNAFIRLWIKKKESEPPYNTTLRAITYIIHLLYVFLCMRIVEQVKDAHHHYCPLMHLYILYIYIRYYKWNMYAPFIAQRWNFIVQNAYTNPFAAVCRSTFIIAFKNSIRSGNSRG